MNDQLDPEESRIIRETVQQGAVTNEFGRCGDLILRTISLAEWVILMGTGNSFFNKARRTRRAGFDALAYVWLVGAPEEEVFAVDWQDPAEFSRAVMAFARKFRPSQLKEMAAAAESAAARLAHTEFETIDLSGPAEKKSKHGPSGPSAT